jgi:hypothetical protein
MGACANIVDIKEPKLFKSQQNKTRTSIEDVLEEDKIKMLDSLRINIKANQ